MTTSASADASIREANTDPIGFFLKLDAPMTESDGPFWQSIKKQIQEVGAMDVVPLIAS